MCNIENSDGFVDVIQPECDRKARKAHTCLECRREIRAGEQYRHTVYKFDGDLTSYKICLHCHVAAEWLMRECGGFLYSQIQDDILEHTESRRPYGIDLFRVAVGMRRKWTKKNGGLMPIPKRPLTTKELMALPVERTA